MKHLSISLVLLPIIFAEEYIIKRQVHLIQSSWIDQPDTFLLPSSMCLGDVSANCTAMGGTRVENKCGCSCNEQDEFGEFRKSTFGFYDNQWKCFENKQVRKQSGCQTIMSLRQDTVPPMTLPMIRPKIGHYVPDLTSNCDIIGGKYLQCDGKWKKLNTTLVKSRFYVEKDIHNYDLLQYSTSQPSTPTINGRVIRLEIECSLPKKSQCVLFKVKGQLKCPVVTPTSPSFNNWTTNYNKSTAEAPERTAVSPTVTDHHNKTAKRSGNHGDNRAGMIAGILAGVVGLFIIVITIILVLKRRKKRYPVPKRSSIVAENECYGLGIDASLKFVGPGRISRDEKEHSTNGSGGLQRNVSERVNRNTLGLPRDVEAHIYDNEEEREYAVPFKTVAKSKALSDVPVYEAVKESKIVNNKKEMRLVPPREEGQAEDYAFEEPPKYEVLEGPFSGGITAAFSNNRGSNNVSPHTSLDGAIPHKEDDESYYYYSVGDVITDQ